MYLPSDKGKACSQFHQKLGEMFDQRRFNLPLIGFFAHIQKVKQIRVFQRLLGQVTAR